MPLRLIATGMLAAGLLAPILMAGGTAAAAPRESAAGTFSTLAPSTNTTVRSAGPNLIITDTASNGLTGTFSGTSVIEERTLVRTDGSFVSHAVETFTGTVNGVAGTATSVNEVSGDTTSFHGRFTIVRGTGGLADLHGQGTFEGSSTTGAGTYSAQIKLGP